MKHVMLMVERKYEYMEVPLDQIDIGPAQARSRKVEENTDELAQSINALGLINPITVYKRADGRFELITGQRRLIAVEKLNWPTISAKVLHYVPSEVEAKALSLTENIMRVTLTMGDIKDSIVMLYHRCAASGQTISKTLGLPYSIVLDTLKYEALPEEMKLMVDQGAVDVEIAKKATDFSTTSDGSVDVKKAMLLAPELKRLVPSQMKKMKKIAQESPDAPAEEMLEEAHATPATHRLVIEMLLSEYDAVKKAASEKGVSEEEVAYTALMKELKEQGYI
jgi:ParB family chromosome partitioning protein